MSEVISKLRNERREIWTAMQDMLSVAEKRDGQADLSAEELVRYNKLEADLDTKTQNIEARSRADELARKLAQPTGNEKRETADGPSNDPRENYEIAFRAWQRGGISELPPEQRATLRAAFVESRDLGVATGAAGGYLVPQGFLDKLTEVLKFYGSVRDFANTIKTASGNDMPWPTNDDTANVGAILGENTVISALDTSFSTKTLKAWMYTSLLQKVSWQALNDSAFDLDQFLSRKLGQRLGRIQNTHFTTGTGTGQPEGILTNMTVGVTLPVGNTLTVTYAGLLDLIHSINPAYRKQVGASFQMHDLTVSAIRKMVDTTGRPIWLPSGSFTGVASGDADTLLGYPVNINSDMPVPAASAKTVAFGNWSDYYLIRDVEGVTMVRLDERFADQLQVGFFAVQRTDGRVDDVNAAKVLVQSAT